MYFTIQDYIEATMKATLTKMWELIPTFGIDAWNKWQKVIFAVILLAVWLKVLGIKGCAFLVIGLVLLWSASNLIMYFEDKVQK